MSYVSDWMAPGKLVASLGAPFWGNLKPTAGDFACLCSLFFDNLSTMLTFSAIWLFDVTDGGDKARELLYKRIIPGCGFVLFLGNVYYSWMATRMKTQFGREFTSQPYGINTVGGFPFLFGIMGPIVWGGGTAEEAWKAGCTGNLIVGLINIGLGIAFSIPGVGESILKYTPIAGLMIPVAGVGITFLAINQIAPNFATPVAGFIPVLMIFVMYYSKAPLKIGSFTVPEVLHWIVPGYALGWAYRLPAAAAPGYAFDWPGGGLWAGAACFEGFADMGPAIGTILPIAISATAGDIMSLVSAYNAGDPFPIGETLISDGLFTALGAIFGSPFGTCIYFGHPVHKKIGGKYFFSFANGVIYLVITLAGIFPFILDITPAVASGPTIMIFGLMLCEECTRVMPQRHHAVTFFALFFAWANYACTVGTVTPDSEVGIGLNMMATGNLLLGMLWAAILVYAIDRKYVAAAFASLVAFVFALLGIIHQPEIKFVDGAFMDGYHSGGNSLWPSQKNDPRYSTSAFQTSMAYLTVTACMLLWHFLQKTFPDKYPQKLLADSDEAVAEDEQAMNSKLIVIGSFGDWWSKAMAGAPVDVAKEAM